MNNAYSSRNPPNALLLKVLDRISALSQARIINEDERDALAGLAQKGFRTGFSELSTYLSLSDNQHPLFQELKKIIAFG